MFVKPDFRKRELELRFADGVVCIYGTAAGLTKLSKLCLRLVENPNQGHIHLEDYHVLTDKSAEGAIAIFEATTKT